MSSLASYVAQKSSAWIVDTGANSVIVDENDPAIVKPLEGGVRLKTSAGVVTASRALIETPFGIREGLVRKGSPRLLPGGEFKALQRIKRVSMNGRTFDVSWEDGIPYICGLSKEHSVATVSLHECRAQFSKSKKSRKGKRKHGKKHFQHDEDGDEEAAGFDVPVVIHSPSRESESPSVVDPGDDPGVSRELDFSGLFGLGSEKARRIFSNPATHVNCGCEFCQIAKKQKPPALRLAGDAASLAPGALIVCDLCTDWVPTRDGETVALIAKDIGSGILFVKALKGKIPAGVKQGLLEFVEFLASVRASSGLSLDKPWTLHSDRGGEFSALLLAEWVTAQGGVQKLAPKGAHVAAAESAVREVLQGTRVSLYAAGLSPKFWAFAAASWVHNKNCDLEAYRSFRQSQNSPSLPAVFGHLVFYKPDEDSKRKKGLPTTMPAAFLGFDLGMRRGAWVAWSKSDGSMSVAFEEDKKAGSVDERQLHVTSTDVGRTGSGLVWAQPFADGRPRMAFRIVVQGLKELTVRADSDIESGAPGMSREEIAQWLQDNPVPVRLVDSSSSCPACRGRHRAHTYDGTCLQAGLTTAQAREFRTWQKGKSAGEQRGWLHKVRSQNQARRADSEESKGNVGMCFAQSAGSQALRAVACSESDLEACKSIDFCGGVSSTCGCSRGSACQAAFACAAHTEVAEPEPEPLSQLRAAVLECPSTSAALETCLQMAPSPRQVAQQPEPESDDDEAPSSPLGSRSFVSQAQHAPPARVFASAAQQRSFVTKKMSAAERAGPGAAALLDEMRKLCKYELFGFPVSSSSITDPAATVCGMAMLGHVKIAERAPDRRVYKGRAVVLGDVIRYLLSGELAKQPALEVGEVAALEEVRAILAWACLNGFPIEQVDLENAYLTAPFVDANGVRYPHFIRLPWSLVKLLPEELRPPPGMADPVFPMMRAGYGHPLSGHIFIAKLKRFLISKGFSLLPGTSSIYVRGEVMLAAYVDDLQAAGPADQLRAFWAELGNEYNFKAEPMPCSEFLGVSYIDRSTGDVSEFELCLEDYIHDTVAEFEKLWGETVAPHRSPGVDNIRCSAAAQGAKTPAAQVHKVQVIVGRLLWIGRTCRPDIMHLASSFGSRVASWGNDCDRELARCMGYLSLTASRGLLFRWDRSLAGRSFCPDLFSDSDWSSPRSQSGFFLCLTRGGNPDEVDEACCLPLHWGSRKQPLATDSSTAAEIVAMHHCVRESLPIVSAVSDFARSREFSVAVPRLLLDNSTALKHVAESPTDSFWLFSKACNLRLGLMVSLRQLGIIRAAKVRTDFNRSDVFTKTFSAEFASKARLASVHVEDLCAWRRPARQARAALWLRRVAFCSLSLFES